MLADSPSFARLLSHIGANLEFAYPGTGNVSDLKLLPEHLDVGMGVVDVRSEQVQAILRLPF